jgi:indole-3-glycerol phosphate synthase
VGTILDQIVATKRRELADAQARVPAAELERRAARAAPPRDFRAALEAAPGIAIIAEVKKASPSAGILRADFDAVALARTYERHGAACVSVLTDETYFQGSLAHLEAIRAAVDLPLLRKDFLLDPYQLLEARAAGADAVLLIAEVLDDATLGRLVREARNLGMQALVELYGRANLPRVLASGARLIGVINRNLHTFVTSLDHTFGLIPELPPDVCLVSESGIRGRADLDRLRAAGVRAALIGETLMAASDVGAKLAELRGARVIAAGEGIGEGP